MAEEKKSLWARLRFPYRLSVMNEETWTELWHVRLSGLGALVVGMLLFLLTLCLLSALIIFTPIRTILPGYTEDIRHSLVQSNERVDSLETSMNLQRQYLTVIQQIMAGEIQSDTIQRLDSMQLIAREELLLAKQQATEEFVAQYEQGEKDNLQLFDVQDVTPMITLFRPVHGVISQSADIEHGLHYVTITTPKNENVTAVLAGAVVFVEQLENDTWRMMVQHVNYLSIYSGIGRILHHPGDYVQAGETLGVMDKALSLQFELWQKGRVMDPQSVIAF